MVRLKNEWRIRSKNGRMVEAIKDSILSGSYFFTEETMRFWSCTIEYGMFSNDTFVTGEDNFDRTKTLYTVRKYDWKNHDVITISEFQQFEDRNEAIRFAKDYQGYQKNIKANVQRKEEMKSLHENGMTYEEIGKKFGLSRQRAHQIINN